MKTKKTFSANHAKKKFAKKDNMERHFILVHEGKRNLKCDSCEKGLQQNTIC